MTATPQPSGTVPATITVEDVVRHRLAMALGGRRGMLEAALPTLAFTGVYLPTHQLRLAVTVSITVAVALVVVRLVQRSTVQFVLNSLVGIVIAALFAARTGRAEDYFLPGIIWSAVTAALLAVSNLVRWPVVGVLYGSATEDVTGWRREPGIVKLCQRLTWILLVPNVIRVAVMLPLYLMHEIGWLAAMKLALGWPLYIAALAAMAWVLARGRTPMPVDSSYADTVDRDAADPDAAPTA